MGMITQLGTFGWNVLPFGPKNGPAHFQREMRAMLGELLDECALVYIDDIVIFSDTFEEHMQHVKQVLERIKGKRLVVAEDKMHMCLSQIKLLGKIVNGHRVAPDPEITKDMINFPAPMNAKHVMSFLGLCGVFMNFVPDYMKIAQPLYKLTRKDAVWHWGEEEQQAFLNLKDAMLSPAILHHPDFTKDFHVFSDASAIGTGAVLMQKHDSSLSC
jgi:hypothetical protein